MEVDLGLPPPMPEINWVTKSTLDAMELSVYPKLVYVPSGSKRVSDFHVGYSPKWFILIFNLKPLKSLLGYKKS